MNHLSIEQQTLLMLLQKSLWRKASSLPEQVNWQAVDTMAKQQGVLALAYDGAVAFKAQLPADIHQKWNQTTMMSVMRNERLFAAQDQVLAWLEAENIPAVVLKGCTVARYYPQPDLRVLGDVDILIPRENLGRVKEIMLQHGYTFHEAEHDFHLGFGKSSAYVEIHYDVTTLPDSRGGKMTKMETSRFLDCRVKAGVSGHSFTALSEQHQALSLLLHMVRHMIEGGIGLRQLCDWAMYMANADMQNFSDNTLPMLERCGLLRYAQTATMACVNYLGLALSKANWCQNIAEENVRIFIQDIFSGGNMGKAGSDQIGRLLAQGTVLRENTSFLKRSLASLSEYTVHRYPITKKHKWLMPFFWVFMTVRYWIRSLFGLREKKSVVQTVKNAKKQSSFLETLEIFKVDDKSDQ